jgi:hypothetical protein
MDMTVWDSLQEVTNANTDQEIFKTAAQFLTHFRFTKKYYGFPLVKVKSDYCVMQDLFFKNLIY